MGAKSPAGPLHLSRIRLLRHDGYTVWESKDPEVAVVFNK